MKAVLKFRFIVMSFVALAIVSAGISPACAFISGNTSFIQICGADGNVQTVEVDASLDPFADEKPSEPFTVEDLEAMAQCPFCFAHTHQHSMVIDSVVMDVVVMPHYIAVGAGSFIPKTQSLRVYDPQGPPAIS